MNDEYKEIVNDCLEHAKNQNGSSFDEEDLGYIVKHYNENHDPKTGQFAPKVDASDVSNITKNLGNIVDPKTQQGKRNMHRIQNLQMNNLIRLLIDLAKSIN